MVRCVCIFLASILLSASAAAQTIKEKQINFGAQGKKLTASLRIPAFGHPVPAIIIVHGTAGIDARGAFYREALEAAGFATLEVDFKSGVFTGPKDRPKNPAFVPYLFAAVSALHEQAEIDRSRIGVLGFSLGGHLALNASLKKLAAPYNSKGLKIAAAVSLYPGCQVLAKGAGAFIGVPTLILVGSKDDYTTPDYCRAAEREANARFPGSVEVVIYEGAYHAFDLPGPRRTIADPNARQGKAVVAYDKAAAEDARKRAVDFFGEKLGAK